MLKKEEKKWKKYHQWNDERQRLIQVEAEEYLSNISKTNGNEQIVQEKSIQIITIEIVLVFILDSRFGSIHRLQQTTKTDFILHILRLFL